MAVVYPLANGNWSIVANWYSGGVAYGQLPLSTDDVYTNNKNLTLDVDNVVIKSLNNASTTGVLINGTLTINTSKTFTANTINSNNIGVLNITSSSNIINLISTTINGCVSNSIYTINISGTGGTVNITSTNIIGNGYGSNLSGAINHNSTGVVNVTGAISSTTNWSIYNNNSGTLNIIGTITSSNVNLYASINHNTIFGITNFTGSFIGGSIGNGWGILNSTGTVNILSNQTMSGGSGYGVNSGAGTTNFGTVGSPINITGAPSSAASGFYLCNHAGNGNVNVFGNIILQNYSFSTTTGLINAASLSGTMTINGNITAGTVANTIGLSISSTGTIVINGNITGGSHATNTPAIYMTAAGTININGTTTAGLYPALFSTVTTAKFNLLGNITNVGGMPAYYGSYNIKISPTAAQTFTFQDTSNVNRLIATSNISPGAPGIADVRFGTVYGSSNEYTGTLRVPNPNTVSLGVLTDNTTGTMLMTPSDFWGVASSGLTTSGSIGERLKNASTVQSNGDQLAAYIV